MSIFMLKSLLAILFLGAALTAAAAMLTMMGKLEKKTDPLTLKKIHKIAGYAFALLLVVLSAICAVIAGRMGDAMSARAVAHSVLAIFLLGTFGLKWVIVKFYRQFLKYAPGLGMTVLVLAFVVFMVSAGYFFLRLALSRPVGSSPVALSNVVSPAGAKAADSQLATQGSPEKGADIFAGLCAGCHHPDREETIVGPGLRGILKREKLPASGKPATAENVRAQILFPYLTMPAFKDLSPQDMADLLAYLGKL